MQLTQNLWTLFFAFFLAHNIYAQTVEYDISFNGTNRIEKVNTDGTALYSRIENDTFLLDSVDINGDGYNLLSIPIQDSGSIISSYLYIENDAIYVNYFFQPDTIQEECWLTKAISFGFDSVIKWETDYTQVLACNFSRGTRLLTIANKLISIGSFREEGDCSSGLYFTELNKQSGQFSKEKIIGDCSVDISSFNDDGYSFIFSRTCTCNDLNWARGDQIYEVDSSLDVINEYELEMMNFIPNSNQNWASISTKRIAKDIFYSYEIRNENMNQEIYKGLILKENDDFKWINLTDSFNLPNTYQSGLYSVVEYDTFLLFLFGKPYRTVTPNTSFATYDSTEFNIVCTNKDLTQVGNIWTETKPGNIQYANLKHSFSSPNDGNLFIQYNTITGNSDSSNNQYYFERISFNSIINSVESELRSNELTFEVYPNPTSGEINIETTNSGKLAFYDLAGKRQLVSNINAGSNKLEINQLPVGVCFLVLTTEDGNRTTQKLIIQ